MSGIHVKQTLLFFTALICVVFPLEMTHWGLGFWAWTGIVVAVIIAIIFDYTNEKH